MKWNFSVALWMNILFVENCVSFFPSFSCFLHFYIQNKTQFEYYTASDIVISKAKFIWMNRNGFLLKRIHWVENHQQNKCYISFQMLAIFYLDVYITEKKQKHERNQTNGNRKEHSYRVFQRQPPNTVNNKQILEQLRVFF